MPLLKAACCQCLAIFMLWLAVPWLAQFQLAAFWLVGLQATIAGLMSMAIRQPAWWLPIHLSFLPAIWLTQALALPSAVFLGVFLLLLLIFWGTIKGEVPLFLSSPAVNAALLEIIAAENPTNLIELGAGIGSVVVPLARKLPTLPITAIENAPLPWLILRWRCRNLANVKVSRQSFWECNFGDFALAFAFLSPLVMPRIGQKCQREMLEAALLVSSSFEIPEQQAEAILTLNDSRQTRLYCYRFPTP
jgi:hypothetical protein